MAALDDYELVRVLARGGMGAVHEAVERATGRRVALKRILAGALDADAVARFLVEGRALARLDHPAIVRVHSLGQAPGGPFMVMDLVAGESLQRRLEREGPLAPGQALAVARALASALAHAHAQGVLHRDLKPANVLIDERGEVRLIDFGLARLQVSGGSLAHLTRTGEVLGTPAYMAPEQADGREVDPRTDVYGLGATLFALLTARPPFEGSSPIAVLHGVLTRDPPAPSRLRPGVSPAVGALVLDCLAKDPSRRPASMSELLARLEQVTAGDVRPPRRVGPLLAGVGALLVGVVVATTRSHPAAAPVDGAPVTSGPMTAEATPAADDPEDSTAGDLASLAAAAADPGARGADLLAHLEALTALGRHDEAARALREAPPRLSDDVDLWLALIRARARIDVEAALAPPVEPAPVAARAAQGRALLLAGRADEVPEARVSFDGLPDRRLILARFEADVASGRPVRGQAMNAALELDPGWIDGIFAWGGYLVVRQRQDAAACLRRLQDLNAAMLAARLQAAASVAAGRREDALAILDRALRSAEDPHALVARADLQLSRGAPARAEADLTRALALEPLLEVAWRLRAGARRQLGRHAEEADDLLAQARLLGAAHGGPSVLVERATALLRAGDPAAALESIREAGAHAADARSERVRGDVLVALHDREGARAAYARVLDEPLPGSPLDHQLSAAGVVAAGGQPTRPWTRSYLDSVAAAPGRDADRWTSAAALLVDLDEPEAADEALSNALAHAPEQAELWAKRAQLRFELGRLDDAEADLDRALAGGANQRGARLLRARVRVALGRDAAALEDLGHLIETGGGPERASHLVERSLVRERLGDLPGALEDARAALELYPAQAARVAELERRIGPR